MGEYTYKFYEGEAQADFLLRRKEFAAAHDVIDWLDRRHPQREFPQYRPVVDRLRNEVFAMASEEVRRLIGYKNLEPAYQLAVWLSRTFPDRAEAHFLHNLVTCLNGKGGGPFYAAALHHRRAMGCPDYTPHLGGDMLRDQAIGLIRFARDDTRYIERAETAIAQARALHQDDPDRLACLADVQGRLAYAQGRYDRAVQHHSRAEQEWLALPDGGNPIFVYNNRVHWLKAVVASQGARSREAARISRLIREHRPPGNPNRHREARVIRVPWAGNRVHDFLTTRRS